MYRPCRYICMPLGAVLSKMHQMNAYCRSELSMNQEYVDQIKLVLDDDGVYKKDIFNRTLACETNIEALHLSYPKLMFYFEDLKLDCDDGFLRFYDGINGDILVPGLEGYICGHIKPLGVFTVNTRYLRIRYMPTKNQTLTGVFSLIITTFSEGGCQDDSFKCKNSRCINESLACNGYNSCGDGSGCDINTGELAGVIVGGVMGIALVGLAMILIVQCTRRGQSELQGLSQSIEDIDKEAARVSNPEQQSAQVTTNQPPTTPSIHADPNPDF